MKEITGRWITKNGKRIYINTNDYMNTYIKEQRSKKERKIIIVTKQEYARLARVIDSNKNKWINGKINSQIIDEFEYYFIYNNYNDFTIIKRRKRNEENDR